MTLAEELKKLEANLSKKRSSNHYVARGRRGRGPALIFSKKCPPARKPKP